MSWSLAGSRGPLGALVVVTAMCLALAGCMSTSMSVTADSSSCTNLPTGACDEQVELWSQRFPGATLIEVECEVPECSRAGGAGTVVVTLADGTVHRDTFGYTGDPNPPPAPTCQRIAAEACDRVAKSTWADQRPSRKIVALDVSCAVAQCTAASGEVEVTVTLADGSTTVAGYVWEGELP